LLIFTNLASVEHISFTIPDKIYGFLFMKGGSWFTCESFIHIVWRVIWQRSSTLYPFGKMNFKLRYQSGEQVQTPSEHPRTDCKVW